MGKKRSRALVRRSPKLRRYLKRGLKVQRGLQNFKKSSKYKKYIASLKAARKAKAKIRAVGYRAKYSRSKLSRDRARKSAAILRLVARNREKLKRYQSKSNPIQGVMIDSQGRLVKGRFKRKATKGETNPLLASRKRLLKGGFSRVSGYQWSHDTQEVLQGPDEFAEPKSLRYELDNIS